MEHRKDLSIPTTAHANWDDWVMWVQMCVDLCDEGGWCCLGRVWAVGGLAVCRLHHKKKLAVRRPFGCFGGATATPPAPPSPFFSSGGAATANFLYWWCQHRQARMSAGQHLVVSENAFLVSRKSLSLFQKSIFVYQI